MDSSNLLNNIISDINMALIETRHQTQLTTDDVTPHDMTNVKLNTLQRWLEIARDCFAAFALNTSYKSCCCDVTEAAHQKNTDHRTLWPHKQQNEHVIFIDLLSGWRQDLAGRSPGNDTGALGAGQGPGSETGALGARQGSWEHSWT